MPILSAKFMRTLQLVLDAAINFRGKPVNGDLLAGRQGYPARYYDPILAALVKARILKGERGPNGGYRFSADPEEITLADVEAVVSSTSTKKQTDSTAVRPMRSRVTGPLFKDLTKRWTHHLGTISIGSLCRKAFRLKGERPAHQPVPATAQDTHHQDAEWSRAEHVTSDG